MEGGPARVLIVGDDPRNVEALRQCLIATGQFAVELARTAAEVRAIVESGRVAAVVVDSDVPRLALGLLQGLAGHLEAVPVVAMSGRASPGVAREVLNAGAADFVPRTPSAIRALPRVVARVVERARLLREVRALRARTADPDAPLVAVAETVPAGLRYDPLTGLLSRQALFAALYDLRARHQGVTVVLIDVAGMREYNVRHGSAVGDQLLRSLADVTREATRSSDVVGRYDGDAIAALLPIDADAARDLIARIETRLADTLRQAGLPSPIALRHAISAGPFAMPDLFWNAEVALA